MTSSVTMISIPSWAAASGDSLAFLARSCSFLSVLMI